MTQHYPSHPTLQEVLGYFAAEETHDKSTLERYLQEYPQYAGELIDVAFEFGKPEVVDTAPLSKVDLDRIEAGRKRFIEASAPKSFDLLASIKVDVQRQAANTLNLPRIAISGFLARRVDIGSIPTPFLRKLVQALGLEEARFRESYCDVAPTRSFAYSYSSEVKPKACEQIDLAKFLQEAGVSTDRIAKIYTEG